MTCENANEQHIVPEIMRHAIKSVEGEKEAKKIKKEIKVKKIEGTKKVKKKEGEKEREEKKEGEDLND